MTEIAITFTPDGKGHALHTEAIDLGQIGRLTVKRATEIEFNDDMQQWCVRRPGKRRVLYRNTSRQACLEWEQRLFHYKHPLQSIKMSLKPVLLTR